MKVSEKVIVHIGMIAELNGRNLSPTAIEFYATSFENFTDDQIINALNKSAKELRGFPAISDVIQRIDDGHPNAEEAWGMLPSFDDEESSYFITDPMRAGWEKCIDLIYNGDRFEAKKVFTHYYQAAVAEARDNREKPKWTFSPGRNRKLREEAIENAFNKKMITAEYANLLLPKQPTENKQLENKQGAKMIENVTNEVAKEQIPEKVNFKELLKQYGVEI